MFTAGFFSYLFGKVANTVSNTSSIVKRYSTILLVIVAIIGVITTINYVSEIASYFGIQTRAQLKDELAVKQKDLEDATKVAKDLEESIKKEVEANKVLDTVISDKDDTVTNLDNKIEEVVVKHKEVTNKVVTKKKVDKVEYTKQEMDSIAKVNIDALWDVYNTVKTS